MLKSQIINDYNRFVKRLKKGYRDDYSYILHKINYLATSKYLDNNQIIYQYLINK